MAAVLTPHINHGPGPPECNEKVTPLNTYALQQSKEFSILLRKKIFNVKHNLLFNLQHDIEMRKKFHKEIN